MADRIAVLRADGTIDGFVGASSAPTYSLEVGGVGQQGGSMVTGYTPEASLCGLKMLHRAPVTGAIPAADIPAFPVGFLYSDVLGNTGEVWYAHGVPENSESLGILTGFTVKNFKAAIGGDGEILWVSNATSRGLNPRVSAGGSPSAPAMVDVATSAGITPMKWLGSAAGFATDASNNEYFMFGEYSGGGLVGSLNVWKVTKPYTDPANWTIALAVPNTDVLHIHSCQYDVHSGAWYVTAGDTDAQVRWFQSTDHGATWTQVMDSTSGWPSQVGRTCSLAFTEDYVYWGNDWVTNHGLWRLPRLAGGPVDFSAPPTKVVSLNAKQSTYSTILMENPRGILFLDRVDSVSASTTGTLDVEFYDFDSDTLHTVATIPRRSDLGAVPFGFRCLTYTLQQGPYDDRIVVGFDAAYPNGMELPWNEGGRRATLALRVVRH